MKKQTLLFLLMLMPMMMSADSVEINYILNQETKEAEVTDTPMEYFGNIVIPQTVEFEGISYSVTSIGRLAFAGSSRLTSVTIPNSVTTIREDAFRGCTSLTSVHISDLSAWCRIEFEIRMGDGDMSVLSNPLCYAHHLFLNGREIKDLIIPNNVTSIRGSFAGCSSLLSVTFPNSVTSIGSLAFSGCSSLTSVNIPNGVTSIPMYAFSGCSSLTSVNIPNSVKYIAEEAFSGCSSLTAVNITDLAAWCSISFCNDLLGFDPNPLSFAHHLFLNGTEVKDLIIPNSVTRIGEYAFSGCSGLASVTIPNSVTSIGRYAFVYCSNLTSVTIPNSITSIGDLAFEGCSSLTTVKISDIAAWCNINFSYADSNPLSKAHHLFFNGVEIMNLNIPNDVTTINKYAFYGCSGLTSVTIPNSVTSIGWNAFDSCSDITSITIGSGIKNIGSKAFANYNNLMDVYCLAKEVPTTSSNIFDNSYVKYATLHVPESSLNQYKRSEPWSQFGAFVGIPEGNNENKCATPVITLLANGKIKVESATEGATCITNITASNAEPLTDGEISLNTPLTVYTVTSYATAEGYEDSDVATATFRYEKAEGDVNGDGVVNISDVIQLVNMILAQ